MGELVGTVLLLALAVLFVWQDMAMVAAACALAAGYEIGLHQRSRSDG